MVLPSPHVGTPQKNTSPHPLSPGVNFFCIYFIDKFPLEGRGMGVNGIYFLTHTPYHPLVTYHTYLTILLYRYWLWYVILGVLGRVAILALFVKGAKPDAVRRRYAVRTRIYMRYIYAVYVRDFMRYMGLGCGGCNIARPCMYLPHTRIIPRHRSWIIAPICFTPPCCSSLCSRECMPLPQLGLQILKFPKVRPLSFLIFTLSYFNYKFNYMKSKCCRSSSCY